MLLQLDVNNKSTRKNLKILFSEKFFTISILERGLVTR